MPPSPSVLRLHVEVPICAFRPFASREYQDTYPVPTPASVYGMLVSLLGVEREHKDRHRGAKIALAVEHLPERSRVFRKLRRGKTLSDVRPDYQDLLSDLRLWVWLANGDDSHNPPLPAAVAAALADPTTIQVRHGGLSLGESSYLIDVITASPLPPQRVHFLRPDPAGFHSLPIWVDHTGDRSTSLRFSIDDRCRDVDEASLPWMTLTPNER